MGEGERTHFGSGFTEEMVAPHWLQTRHTSPPAPASRRLLVPPHWHRPSVGTGAPVFASLGSKTLPTAPGVLVCGACGTRLLLILLLLGRVLRSCKADPVPEKRRQRAAPPLTAAGPSG